MPLPAGAGFGTLMAVGYYVIGRIQQRFPPWFCEHAVAYADWQSRLFAGRPAEPAPA